MQEKTAAIVGCGIWGRNLVRNFYALGALHTVCDLDFENLKIVKENYEGVCLTSDFESLLNSKEIQAIIIATPSHTHYHLVKKALLAGKHVYVEKPIATSAKEAFELNKLAQKNDLTLMVGHLLLYHPAVNRLREIVQSGALGEVSYAQSDRLNVNYFKNDRSVMWDLAPHDLSMMSYVVGKDPINVISAVGCSSDKNDIMDIVHLGIKFEDGVTAHISNSWITPAKHVRLMVRGTKATAILDDTLQENKLIIFDNFAPGQQNVEYPDYLEIEPLKLECQHFLSCIKTGQTPRTDGENGYKVVKILEQADKIMLGAKLKELDKVKFSSSRSKANV
ncbi:MAG: Gfo/Idh/MocA family oxidoreductase [Candidatus Gastranaerophilales bacterium]|nr:Gfo/Idh/MocA family oxidoreductase [Candidatus Gastranaerophilales bacterium]